jgi:hypothetical protein
MNKALKDYLDEQARELEQDVQSALQACGGDPMRALAAAIIANSFLMEENERFKQQISSGLGPARFARRQ